MAVKSIYLPEPAIERDIIHVAGEEHHHLTVTRAEAGEAVDVFDGHGSVWLAEVLTCGKRETTLRILQTCRMEKRGPELFLGLSLVKVAAFEFALEKAVEIGVTRIVPIVAGRSNASPPRRPDRWHRIVIEAAKQSKRYWLP